MADLRARNACNRKQTRRSSSTIKVLPKELLMEVLARVASGSVSDLYKAKICCREFLHAADDDYVYEHVSLEKFPVIPWFITEKEFSFLKRCKESGNSESLYREGMVEYFSSLNLKSGLESLRLASQKGHKDAKYVYGMILICSDDEEQRKQGLQLLRFLRMSKCIRRSRNRVKKFIWSMWVRNRVVRDRRPLCHFHKFDNSRRLHSISRGWPPFEEDDGIDISCEYCIGDYELGLFCDLLRV
ncbi:F-box protein At2g35280-like [Prosopis cineraria]|uniref:F-box protein At2g35280-like n=1 Tax=Prosopis cineraria TaxID=364024 RepID=UPI0024101E2C|nr:F-box protein At2g35280-like [Prosopis cineraria]